MEKKELLIVTFLRMIFGNYYVKFGLVSVFFIWFTYLTYSFIRYTIPTNSEVETKQETSEKIVELKNQYQEKALELSWYVQEFKWNIERNKYLKQKAEQVFNEWKCIKQEINSIVENKSFTGCQETEIKKK